MFAAMLYNYRQSKLNWSLLMYIKSLIDVASTEIGALAVSTCLLIT